MMTSHKEKMLLMQGSYYNRYTFETHPITAYDIIMLSFPCRHQTPLSYRPGTGKYTYLQAQMQQQHHQQQQHASAQQQRSETSLSRPISGLPGKSTSQEKSQQQKAMEQAAAAQQPLMAPGVMMQPLAVQMAGMIPMATQEDLAKFQLE